MLKVLFTGAGGAGYEAFYRLLNKKYDLHFCDANIELINSKIPLNKKHLIPLANESNFEEKVREICIKNKIDLLIPGVDEELVILSNLKNEPSINVLLPPLKFIKIHLNKLTSNQFLISKNLPAPKVIRADLGSLKFPCIVKPIYGRGSRNVFLANNEKEVNAQIIVARKKRSEFILQEYITGQEFTVNISADQNGELKAIIPVKVNLKKGITISADLSKDKDVIESCERIHNSYKVGGCYNIQLIKDNNGLIKPFEINPRISTTTCLSIAAGADIIGNFLNINNNINPNRKFFEYNPKISLRRFWYNEISEN